MTKTDSINKPFIRGEIISPLKDKRKADKDSGKKDKRKAEKNGL